MYYDFGRFENIVSAFRHVCYLRSRCDGWERKGVSRYQTFPTTPCCSTSFTSHTHGPLSKRRAIFVADFPYSRRFENIYSRFRYIGLFIIPPSADCCCFASRTHFWTSLLIVLLYDGIGFHYYALSDQAILSRTIISNSKYGFLPCVRVRAFDTRSHSKRRSA